MSLWLPRFATDRLRRDRTPDRRPTVTVMQDRGGHRLAAVDLAAARAGLAPGMPLADARAMVPNLETAPADPAGDARGLERLALWAGRYSPWTAVDGSSPDASLPGAGLWLDIGGCAHLFGGEEALLADLCARLGTAGYTVRAGLADTPGAAWAMARYAPGTDASGPFSIIAPGAAAARNALAGLPVAALRLPAEAAETLVRLGLRQIADLYPLPRAALALRAGLAPALRLDQALGERDEPLNPLTPPPAFRARLAFPEPIGRAEDIALALDRLLAALARQLAQAGKGARRLEFTLYRVDGGTARAAVGTGRPERDPDHLARLFREKLDGLDPGFGVETAILAAGAVDDLATQQATMAEPGAEHAGGGDLDRLLDRLVNRLGARRVGRLAARGSHLPERAQALVTAADGPATADFPDPPAPRPLHLLPVPEPVDVTAAGADGPPLAFRWRGADRRVARAEGPERIAREWWRETDAGEVEDGGKLPKHRDYYRAEDEGGGCFWLYRQAPALPGQAARWYLHGLFA